MSQRTAASILKLPDSFNGHALAVSLLTSSALSFVTIPLVASATGYYQLFILTAIAPVTFIHHMTTVLSVCCTNVGFMALFEAAWLAGTAVGFWFYAEFHDDPDMVIMTGLAMTSNVVALLECLVFLALIVFCIRARNERLRAPGELDLTPCVEDIKSAPDETKTNKNVSDLVFLFLWFVVELIPHILFQTHSLIYKYFLLQHTIIMKGAVAVTLLAALPAALAALSASSLKISDDTLTLPASYNPIIPAYWTGLPNHRRTPFAVSPDGKSAYLAFLSAAGDAVYVQPVNPTTFTSNGDAVKIANAKEAGGLVAQNDGFAIMVTLPVSGTDAPPNSYPVATLIRYKNGSQAWSTPLNGPGVHVSDGLSASPDMNGDLVYSAESGLYGAYFVVTAYSGWASGHFGDSVQYVNDDGKLQTIAQSSSWGCSHNTGIAFEAASAPPFASVCAEDHGAIWLNTDTRSMNGIKIANENVTNGVSGEPMGGMGGSYSNLAALDGGRYIFAWQSRGAVNLTPDSWMGDGFTQASPRWLNHNVAIATMDAKNKLAGKEAISTVGASSGDDQVNWLTKADNVDHRNVRVAAAGGQLAVVTWEELTSPSCQPVPMSCTGTFSGTYAQLVDATGTGSTVGDAVNLGKDVTVSGDMVTIGSQVCWPFAKQTWDISGPKSSGTPVTKLSFACLSTDGSAAKVNTTSAATTSAAATSAAASTSAPAANTAIVRTSVTSAAAAETSAAATEPAATSAAPETTPVAEPTSAEPEPTSAAPEPTSADPEPTSVVTAEPEVTPAVSESAPAPEVMTTEAVPTSVPQTASTRRHRPTRYWGRPHGSATFSAEGQAAPTNACGQ